MIFRLTSEQTERLREVGPRGMSVNQVAKLMVLEALGADEAASMMRDRLAEGKQRLTV